MSNERFGKGISRQGLDAAFQAEETRKSDLILQASLLREQGRNEEASQNFAEAAAIEEHLEKRCREQGLAEKSFVHAFSAAGCWAKAGDFYHAITLCDALLQRPGLTDRLRLRVQEYADTLRARRDALFADLMRASSSVEG